MDSLAAVFTRLFFPDLEMATNCLSNLLALRLVDFFSRRRFTAGLQSYFARLLRLLAFHVPGVASHFAHLAVPLTGLTAGWIYTLFAHSMPLDRTEILWDSLLSGAATLPMFVYVAILHQSNQQYRLQSLNQEKICTLLSNFPEFDLDRCLQDAHMFAAATPISLAAHHNPVGTKDSGPESVTRSIQIFQQTHGKMCSFSEITESRMEGHQCKYCLYCLSECPIAGETVEQDWTETEIDPNDRIGDDRSSSTSSSPFNPGAVDYRQLESNLVPQISPGDALRHLSRSDCVLVDMRSKEEHITGCLMHSVHCCLTLPDVATSLLQLTGAAAWREAVASRKVVPLPGRLPPPPTSPGLVMILHSGDACGEPYEIACTMGYCLIEQGIDRVCLIAGGARALFRLPQIVDYFVSPCI